PTMAYPRRHADSAWVFDSGLAGECSFYARRLSGALPLAWAALLLRYSADRRRRAYARTSGFSERCGIGSETMEALWFTLLAWMLGVYVALDGMDFGVGVLHLFIAKTPSERGQVLRSIGPVWDGNEVWLVAAGGTLFAAFPGLY